MMDKLSTLKINIDGKEFELDYYSFFDRYYSNKGRTVEPQTREWFLKELKETDTVFDIGAHIGLYTLVFSLRTENVVSFEPTSTYETLLVPNLKKNNIFSPKLEKLALGNQSGFKKDKIFRIWGNEAEEMDYNFITLDEYILKNEIKPNFIKIDVDSFDYEVLLGAQNYLSSHNVTLCVESSHALSHRGYSPIDIENLMNDMGYKILTILDKENIIFRK